MAAGGNMDVRLTPSRRLCLHSCSRRCCVHSAFLHALHMTATLNTQALGRRIPFAFIEDTQQRFFAAFGDGAQTAAAYEYEAQFSRVCSRTGYT